MTRLVAASIAASALILTGCGLSTSDAAPVATGSSSPAASSTADATGADKVRESVDALAEANSYRISGTLTQDGKTVSLDMRVTNDGLAKGTLTTAETGKMQYIQTKDAVYVGGKEFIKKVAPQAVSVIGDRYMKMPAAAASQVSGPVTGFAPKGLAAELKGPLDNAGAGITAIPTVVNGQQAFKVSDPEGDYFVAATGKPYPLRFDLRSAEISGHLSFAEYDKDFDISAPANPFVVPGS